MSLIVGLVALVLVVVGLFLLISGALLPGLVVLVLGVGLLAAPAAYFGGWRR